MTPRFPHIEVQLSGEDSNGFAIVCRVRAAMKKAGIAEDVRKAFSDEATSGDYDHLIQTCMSWVTVH